MPQLLPPSSYAVGSSNSDAYTTCVDMEAYALSLPPPPDHGPSTLVCARLLGYMILHAPTDDGRANISTEITSCENDFMRLCGVACKYIDHFVCCFRSTKVPTPSPSNHPSRPSFSDNAQDASRHLMEDAPSDYTTAKEKALMRDGYRCVITGRYDLTSVENGVPAAVQGMALMSAGSLPCTTQLAHVFPPSTNQNIGTAEQGGDKHDYASGVWAVMERFGQVNGFLELNGSDIHRLGNVMTMEPNVHEFFDRLALWLEATPVEHTYTVHSRQPYISAGLPATVTFTSTVPGLPLPDPRYLALHAACAKVAHLSGAGQYIERMFGKLGDMKVLASNGSSAEVLSFALGKSCIAVA